MNRSARLADAARPAAPTEAAKRRFFPALPWLIAVSFSAADAGEAVDPAPGVTGSRPSIQQLLQRLEQQNERLEEQNKRLARQNAELAEQNHLLGRRLENLEGRAEGGTAKAHANGGAAAAGEGNGGSDLQALRSPHADGGAATTSAGATAAPKDPATLTMVGCCRSMTKNMYTIANTNMLIGASMRKNRKPI